MSSQSSSDQSAENQKTEALSKILSDDPVPSQALAAQKRAPGQSPFNQPDALIQHFKTATAPYCLFLDIDGTLAEFCNDPENSFIPEHTLKTLQGIQQCQVPVIAVTGRQVQVAQQLFKPLALPVAGLHGLDIVLDSNTSLSPDLSSIDFEQLRQSLHHAWAEYPRLLLEDKQHSFALHYRQCPELEPVAHDIMQQLQTRYPQMKLNYGKCVVEILPLQADKGHAIQTILTHSGLGHVTPVFIGDDLTDESGFRAVNARQGLSIKVGAGATEALYRLKDIAAVAEFLSQFHQFLHCCAKPHAFDAQQQHGEQTCQN